MSLASPGFGDPVLDSQACFRAVLDAMARPGTVHVVSGPASPPAPLHRATAAALLTLVDIETPLWLDEGAAAAGEWIAFHCGAPRVSPGQAAFGAAVSPVDLGGFAAGSDEAPEEGATIIVQVASLGSGQTLRLSGPGLAAPALLRVGGLAAGFVEAWRGNHALYPRGVDLVLCSEDRLAAFPRTLTVEEG